MKIAIVGGGIAGLTAALSLQKVGLSPVLFERAAGFEEIGAGLQLGPNAVKVLDDLGLGAGLRVKADMPQRLEIRSGYSAQAGLSLPLGHAAETRWGAPYLHIHRADLISLLGARVRDQGIEVCTGSQVAEVAETASGCSLQLTNGTTVSADVVIAADGIRSGIRQQLWGEGRPDFAGSVAWRAVVDVETLGRHAPKAVTTVWTGRGCHAVTYKLRGGSCLNLVAVVDTPKEVAASWHETGAAEQAPAPFRGFQPVVLKMLRNAPVLHRWGIYQRAIPQHWSIGRVCLVGDACHAMPPFLAQGAAMAIEDGYMLARSLAATSSFADAFQAFQSARFRRVERVHETSQANGRRFHTRSVLGRMAALSALNAADGFNSESLLQQFDWLYSYDPVTAQI